MKNKISSLLLFLAFISICFVFYPSCKSGSPAWRSEKIDSFARVLRDCEMMMNHDKEVIRKRINVINSSLVKLNTFASDSFTHDFIRSIDQYTAAKDIYIKFMKNEPEMFIELNALKTQLLTMKKTSDDGKITDSQFKLYIHRERENILKLYEVCEEIAEPIDKIEPMYLRTAPRIEAFSDSLQKVFGKN